MGAVGDIIINPIYLVRDEITMNRILRVAVTVAFVVGFGSAYAGKTLWACGETCGGEDGHSNHESSGYVVQTKAEGTGEKAGVVKDPVCGMEVTDIKKAPSAECQGKVYYFCSDHCKKTFKKDPASYIHAEAQPHGEGGGHTH